MPISFNGTTGAVTGIVSASSSDLSTALAAKVSTSGQTGTVNLSTATVTGAGMDLINKTDFTSVSSVSINNCFSSTYTNYRIMIDAVGTTATPTAGQIRMRSAGTDASGGFYFHSGYYSTQAGGVTGFYAGSAAQMDIFALADTVSTASLDIFRPNVAAYTSITGNVVAPGSSTANFLTRHGWHYQATSYDGISFFTASGTMTGTVRIYGYRNS
jgi:hypothetical protein